MFIKLNLLCGYFGRLVLVGTVYGIAFVFFFCLLNLIIKFLGFSEEQCW